MRLNKRTILVHGIGINDVDYNVYNYGFVDGKRKCIWRCPFYEKWKGMLQRCYCASCHEKHPTYVDCSTIQDWHYLSKFKAWMENQDYQNKCLDKDLLFPGNKVYGPDTCIFVDYKVNNFFIDAGTLRGEYPIGVSLNQGRFMATCSSILTGKNKNLGRYNTPEEAHYAWLKYKLEQSHILADMQTDERIKEALITRCKDALLNFTK